MDGDSDPDEERDEGRSTDGPLRETESGEQPEGVDPIVERPRGRRPRIEEPWEALERLDRQWEDRTPIEQLRQPVAVLALTTSDDPRGWDYIGALVGASPSEVARACEAWLEAQLAADAIDLGNSLRPRVELVPSGRLWFVVRTAFDVILVIDGPGFLTPLAAAVAASRRYHAELMRTLHGAPGTATIDDDGRSEESDAHDVEASDAKAEDAHTSDEGPAVDGPTSSGDHE